MTFFAFLGYGRVKLNIVDDASSGLMQITVMYDPDFLCGYYELWNFDAKSTYAVD